MFVFPVKSNCSLKFEPLYWSDVIKSRDFVAVKKPQGLRNEADVKVKLQIHRGLRLAPKENEAPPDSTLK